MMLPKFLSSESKLVVQLADGVKTSGNLDLASLRKIAHTLKGSSAYVCANTVSRLSREIQEACDQRQEAVVRGKVVEVQTAYARAEKLIAAKIQSSGSS